MPKKRIEISGYGTRRVCAGKGELECQLFWKEGRTEYISFITISPFQIMRRTELKKFLKKILKERSL